MRFFIAKNGATIVDKQVFCGDDVKINAIVNKFITDHPLLTILELDQATFDASIVVPVQTQAQKDWATFKAQQPAPTALQGILYLAKYLGLEP